MLSGFLYLCSVGVAGRVGGRGVVGGVMEVIYLFLKKVNYV